MQGQCADAAPLAEDVEGRGSSQCVLSTSTTAVVLPSGASRLLLDSLVLRGSATTPSEAPLVVAATVGTTAAFLNVTFQGQAGGGFAGFVGDSMRALFSGAPSSPYLPPCSCRAVHVEVGRQLTRPADRRGVWEGR